MRAKNAPDSLSLQCPKCGYQCSFRISRLDRTRTCQSCGVLFFINDRGKCVIDHPRARSFWTARLGTFGRHFEKLSATAQPVVQQLKLQWLRLPEHLRRTLAISLVGFSALALGSWLVVLWSKLDNLANERPETLNVRAELVCQAVLLNDDGVLSGLSTRDTANESRSWLLRVRPKAWPETSALANSSKVNLQVLFKSLKNQQAAVYFDIVAGAAEQKNQARVSGTLCWVLGSDGRWMLDGSRTLKELDYARSTD